MSDAAQKEADPNILLDVTVYDGKYRLIQRKDEGLQALRWGEPWRDLTGDGFVLALGQEIESLRDRMEEVLPWVLAMEGTSDKNDRVVDLFRQAIAKSGGDL